MYALLVCLWLSDGKADRAEFYLVGVKPSINERDDGFRVLIS